MRQSHHVHSNRVVSGDLSAVLADFKVLLFCKRYGRICSRRLCARIRTQFPNMNMGLPSLAIFVLESLLNKKLMVLDPESEKDLDETLSKWHPKYRQIIGNLYKYVNWTKPSDEEIHAFLGKSALAKDTQFQVNAVAALLKRSSRTYSVVRGQIDDYMMWNGTTKLWNLLKRMLSMDADRRPSVRYVHVMATLLANSARKS